MATINSRETVNEIIKRGGYYAGDPRVVRIVEYNNMFDGAVCFGLIYKGEDLDRYHSSPAVRNPKIIWEAK